MSTYFRDRHQGVGAIAAAAPAPRSAPAPTIGSPTFSREARRGDPMLNLPRRVRYGAPSEVLPGVVVRSASLVRPVVLMSGVRPGQPPGGGYGRSGMGAINLDEDDDHTGGSGGSHPPGGGGSRGARLSARASTMGMKPAAYIPPVAPLSISTVGLRRQQPHVMTAPPPRIGTGIGQAGGNVAGYPPSPYGPGTAPPLAPFGSGMSVTPALEEYGAPVDVGIQVMTPISPTLLTAATPAASSFHMTTNAWLLLGGSALALYLLTRKRKNPSRR